MYYDGYGYSSPSLFGGIGTTAVVGVVSLILAIVGGLVLMFTFLSRKNEYKFSGFLGWMYKFLNFKSLFAENLLKALYIICAAWLSLSALGTFLFTEGGSVGSKLLVFLLTITLGNVLLRLVFEFSLVTLVICRNTSEINFKMGGKPEADDENKIPQQQETQFAPQNNYNIPQPNQNQYYQQNYSQPETARIEAVYCASCGQPMSADSTVCPHCGQPRQ